MRLLCLLLIAGSLSAQDPKARLAKALGPLPETRTPLNARVTGSFERDGYRVEKVVFESQPGFRVTADLFIPTTGKPPYPAVLGVAGHSDNGKANATYQHAWTGFAKRGFVVLAYDPPGQGERLEYYDAELGRSRLGAGVNEHIQAGLQCLLTGSTIANYFVWDGIRAFDYLSTRPEVDPKRIAVAGNSGGGTQAALLAAFEPRLAAAVSSCYMTRWRELMDGPGPQDAEQILPGLLSNGGDFLDYIAAFAPRPFLITSAIRDYFPIAGARATYQEAVRLYEGMGVSEKVGFFEYDDTHGWSQPRREAAYRWLDKWLRGVTTDGKEAPAETELESVLWVTPTGQLATSLGSETVYSLNRKRAEEMMPRRSIVAMTDDASKRALIRKRLGIQNPSLLARTVAPGAKPALVAVGMTPEDRKSFEDAGYVVEVVTVPQFAAGRGGYTGAYQAAAKEWLYGRNLIAPRVTKILGARAQLAARPDVDPKRVYVWGRGGSGVAAIVAAALDPEVAGVVAEAAIPGWLAVAQTRLHEGMAEVVVPGVLQDFDLPDVAAILGGKLLLLDPKNPAGGPADLPALKSGYPNARIEERVEGAPAVKALAK